MTQRSMAMIDLDNTLSDREGALRSWRREFSLTNDLTAEDEAWILELDGDGYGPRDVMFRSICDRWNIPEGPIKLMERYRRRVVELTNPTPGAIRCLATLRAAGHPLAIVTNGATHQHIDR